MKDISLISYTGVQAVDRLLQTVIRTYQQVFPNRIRGYYLVGSYAEGSAVPWSDIDLFVIFADAFVDPQEAALARERAQQCAATSPIRLDLVLHPQSTLGDLHPVLRVALKLGSLLIQGIDIRESIPLPSPPEYRAALRSGAQAFIMRLRKMTEITTVVGYPDAKAPFFGYTVKSIPEWYPRTVKAGTKELVATASRIASTIVAYEMDKYLPGKQEAIQLFRATGSTWAPFVNELYHQCKLKWEYRIPRTKRDRQHLYRLCKQMLPFENMFLRQYCSGA